MTWSHRSRRRLALGVVAVALTVGTQAAAQEPPPPPPPMVGAPVAAPEPTQLPPPTYVSPRAAERNVRLVPYEGGQIPPGATLVSKPRTGLLIAGGVIFAVSYLPWAIVVLAAGSPVLAFGAAGVIGLAIVLLPVIGPLLATLIAASSGPIILALFLGDTLLQILGLVLVGMGFGSSDRFVAVPATGSTPPRSSLLVVPGVQGLQGSPLGATLALRF